MERDDRKTGNSEARAGSREPQRAAGPAPGKVTRTSKLTPGRERPVQRKAAPAGGAAAPARAKSLWDFTTDPSMDAAHRGVAALAAPAEPGNAFATATSGTPASLPHAGVMESAFGQSFAGVEAHVGTPEARAGLAELGARAAAFGDRVAFADPAPDTRLVAHEIAHVVQQRGGRSGIQAKPSEVSQPGDAAEVAADRAAEAVVRGEPAPDVGTTDGITLHRASVPTNGGTFDNDLFYSPSVAGQRVGGNARIRFLANDLVEAPTNQIALIQTVKAETNRVGSTNTLNATADQTNTAVSTDPDDTQLVVPSGSVGAGRAVDIPIHHPGRTDANHNPIYGVGFSSADTSTNLTQGTPTLGMSRRGDHVRNPDGSFQPANPAIVEDGPGRIIGAPGQMFDMSFEVAALVTGGPMANTYLGTIEWGWQSDAAGTPTMKPMRAAASGAPTSEFMGAAQTWNNATFHQQDPARTPVDSIDIPITSLPSSVQAAVNLPTSGLITRLATVTRELVGLAPGVDRTNKEFEKRALESELGKRKAVVDVSVIATEDWLGSDEVYVRLTGPHGGQAQSPVHDLNDGESHSFQVLLRNLLPLDGAVTVDVFDEDSPDGDDKLVSFAWPSPFAPATSTNTLDDARYRVTVRFER